jgi:hypothetical protein
LGVPLRTRFQVNIKDVDSGTPDVFAMAPKRKADCSPLSEHRV